MTTQSIEMNARLASGYDELRRVDQALREAERRLHAAHVDCARQRVAEQPQEIYREVQSLRDRSRRVLSELGENWVADR